MHQLVYITAILFLASFGSSVRGNRAKPSTDRSFISTLTVNNGGPWGAWGLKEMCPARYYAAGFRLKVEYPITGDDSALNGILLYCINTNRDSSGLHTDYATVKSDAGSWGEWTNIQWCKSGRLTSFQLAVEPRQGAGDDTAANNIRFKCSKNEEELTGESTSWGVWGSWSESCKGQGICGIQTKVEEPQGAGDDTALNDVKFFCCD